MRVAFSLDARFGKLTPAHARAFVKDVKSFVSEKWETVEYCASNRTITVTASGDRLTRIDKFLRVQFAR